MKTQVILGSAILLAGILVNAVNAANKCDSYIPRHYIARHISSPIKVDGSLDDEAWKKASWSVPFTNINDGANVSDAFKTRVKLLWDERFVYFGAEIFDPTSVPSNTSDPEKFSQSNFGILVDPGRTNHNYKEVRVNPFGRTRQFAWSKPPSNGGCATDDWSLGAASSYAISINAKKSMSRVNLGGGSWTLEWVLPLSSLQMSKKRGLFDFGYRSNWQFVRTGWGNSHYRKRSNIPLSNNSTNTHYQ
ncbi:hypothetical protein K7432_016399 [Basidiobolus ranarum]|uniref:Carbohydrate-binding domain-containing protein n=1 Tax=Basidiobolus ranarum TaxID=34480 RepID=A0ABR2VLP3_9FUNG